MLRKLFCLILILFAFPAISSTQLLAEIRHPLVHLAVVSFFIPNSTPPAERAIFVANQIERALLSSSRISVSSLEDYKILRQKTPDSMSEYWSQVSQRGIVNPFNIKADTTQVFESIVEFEVAEMQRLLNLWSKSGTQTYELRTIVESLKNLLSVYQAGAQFRDLLDERTRVLENIPVLNWLRKAGQNIVNPIVRRVLYSDAVLDAMRSQIQANFSSTRQRIAYDPPAIDEHVNLLGQSALDTVMASKLSELEFLKPLKTLDTKVALELAREFFDSLPQATRGDIVWFWINNPQSASQLGGSVNHFLWFFKNRHPHSLAILDHFLRWTQDPIVVEKFRNLSELPLLPASVSLAKIAKENLSYSQVSHQGDSSVRFLGEANQRSWLGKIEMNLKFYLDPEWSEPSERLQFTLKEFLDKNPKEANFIKRRLAAIVLHNAFSSGARSILSEDVRVFYSGSEKSYNVHIMPMGARDSHPMDDAKRFIESVARLPIKPLTEIPMNELDSFLQHPENLRWVMQMHQLQKMVGNDILKSESERYLIRHPQYLVHFFRKKWIEPKFKSLFDGQRNRCSIFYGL